MFLFKKKKQSITRSENYKKQRITWKQKTHEESERP